MSNHEVAELTWENGQPVMHGLGGLLATAHQKSTWIRAHDTLESIVQQAACQRPKSNFLSMPQDWTPTSISSTVAPSGGTTMPPDVSGRAQSEPTLKRKQVQSDSGYLDTNGLEECEPSSGGCASVSAFRSLKRSKTLEDDSHSHCESSVCASKPVKRCMLRIDFVFLGKPRARRRQRYQRRNRPFQPNKKEPSSGCS
ncbi:uncharacterized protein LOC129320703 isoform X2 [Prosopis cineraria]|uniref:uncharacterized protein LOC129320703 isoform X2 n=1 Tax=Prosopis cineraria TaxID=364024 RepID=UPI0024107EDF|nr:uncharacterized protein LOC129320703 isoform X2 [Prosopis cineraria]